MGFNRVHRSAVGLAAATSNQDSTRSGAALDLNLVPDDGFAVECISDLTTSSVTATFTPQVSMDNSTWLNWKEPQAPAQVAHATGTGSQVVTRTALHIGPGVKAYAFFRCNAVLGGAGTAAADKTTVTYRWGDGLSFA